MEVTEPGLKGPSCSSCSSAWSSSAPPSQALFVGESQLHPFPGGSAAARRYKQANLQHPRSSTGGTTAPSYPSSPPFLPHPWCWHSESKRATNQPGAYSQTSVLASHLRPDPLWGAWGFLPTPALPTP